MIELEHEIKEFKNGLLHFGVIGVRILFIKEPVLEIIENYPYDYFKGTESEMIESIPSKGYKDWKKGVFYGIEYAYSKLDDKYIGLKVIIDKVIGLHLDSNSIILAFIASRVILSSLLNTESYEEKGKLEQLVFNSWDYDLEAQLNFENYTIVGQKLSESRYKVNEK
ncbi:hypothetical protein [Nonlabens sp. Asnod3-A02]|uniref:hypothetical protein n=1 Tax=Nonlabens sp. Asnod3-A02 TaxID=3160579 RepID=UPI00387024A9